MNQLEHGYSVSETENENENGGLLSGIGEGDILSLKSGLSLMAGAQNFHQQVSHGVPQTTMHGQVNQNEMLQKIRQ